MITRIIIVLSLVFGSVSTAVAHDMFLIAEDHDLPIETSVDIALYNGTYDESLNVIDRDRMIDVSVVDGTGSITHPSGEAWRDEDQTSLLTLNSGPAGAMVVGVSTRPRVIELSADDFNEYLRHDGVIDTLEARQAEGIAERAARERYAKHVKIVLEIGGETSTSWQRRLGYPVEFVPLVDPNSLEAGDVLEVLLLVNGVPLADQLVYASHAGHHAHGDDGEHRAAVTTRTDEDGVARIGLAQAGRWYLRVIHMVPADEAGLDYVSNWATLTFEAD